MSHPILSNRIASKQRAIISDTVATVHTLMELERKTWHAPLLYSAGLFVAFIPEYMTFKRWCTSQRKTEHNHRVSVLIVYVKSLVGGSSLQMFTSKQRPTLQFLNFMFTVERWQEMRAWHATKVCSRTQTKGRCDPWSVTVFTPLAGSATLISKILH